ncbi:MAG: molybdopterin molybdotransferase MoeA, partial [Planctomycetes bacterium]|nr:molybdopterin molybdotransferase MoeA [Planctomycetota bacterium]
FEAAAGKSNIAQQGEDLRRGDVVLEAGRALRPPEVGLLAMVGRREVEIHQRPRVAILATGDELIEPAVGRVPRPGQTRNCNNFSLLAECARAGFQATALGIARDTREELETKIRAGLEADVLLVSGGVSMGKYDLVPEVFEALGVVVHFTKVAIKPGKPTVFATRGKKLVFGLPGNPVSVIVVFRLFVEPALRRLAGQQVVLPRLAFVRLAAPVRNRGDRRSYLPVRLRSSDRELLAEPVPSHGSADLMALTNADALIQVEAGAGEVSAGAEVPALLLEG